MKNKSAFLALPLRAGALLLWSCMLSLRAGALLLWACMLSLRGCAPPSQDGIDTPAEGRTMSVQWLKECYRGRPLAIVDDVSLRVRVVSTDAEGQFARSLWVQDATGAIELKTDLEPTHERYPPGQWMAVRCAGLTLGAYGGALQLGATSRDGRYEVGFIAEDDLARHLVVYGLPVEEPAPVVLTPRDFAMRWTGCLVRVPDVEFIAEEAGLTWGATKDHATRHAVPAANGKLGVKSEKLCVMNEELGAKSEVLRVKSEKLGVTNEKLTEPSSDRCEAPVDSSLFTAHSSLGNAVAVDTLAVRTSPDAVFAGRVLPRGPVALTGILTHFAGRYELVVINPPE